MNRYRITFLRNRAKKAQTVIEANDKQDAEKKFNRYFRAEVTVIVSVELLPSADKNKIK